jgi:hypothetical protein
MADTAVSVTTLTAGTVSADVITTAEGGTTVAAGNTAVIDVGNVAGTVILSFYAASAATATVQAGDYPLAVLAGLGAGDAQTLPAGDVVLMVVDSGRHMHDDGKVRVDIASNDTVVGAHRIPKTVA